MIHVHDIFVCKPGFASKMAKALKESLEGEPEFVCITTDMTGEFNKVTMVTKYDDLGAYHKSFEKWNNPSPEMKEKMAKMPNHTEMYLTGCREIYKVW
jgi:hypothetical protein